MKKYTYKEYMAMSEEELMGILKECEELVRVNKYWPPLELGQSERRAYKWFVEHTEYGSTELDKIEWMKVDTLKELKELGYIDFQLRKAPNGDFWLSNAEVLKKMEDKYYD